jgi:catalase
MAPSQYRLAAELVAMIHENFQGLHPGYRGVHAQGRYYAAVFKATPEAKKLSLTDQKMQSKSLTRWEELR